MRQYTDTEKAITNSTAAMTFISTARVESSIYFVRNAPIRREALLKGAATE